MSVKRKGLLGIFEVNLLLIIHLAIDTLYICALDVEVKWNYVVFRILTATCLFTNSVYSMIISLCSWDDVVSLPSFMQLT